MYMSQHKHSKIVSEQNIYKVIKLMSSRRHSCQDNDL